MHELTTLSKLEVEINFYLGQTAQNIIEVGKRLIQAKSIVAHGKWQQWLQENFQLSRHTAERFMNVAERFSKTSNVAHFGSSQMIAMLSLPSSEETEKFIEEKAKEGKAVADMTIKQLREEIADYKSKLETADKEHQQSLFEAGEDSKAAIQKLNDEHQREISDLSKQLDELNEELKKRPTVEPDDYKSTKNALVEAQIALARSQDTAERQADDFKKQSDETANKLEKARKEIKKLKELLDAKAEIAAQVVEVVKKPTLFVNNGIGFIPDEPYKLLLTDPPYSTDVDNIDEFAQSWLPNALKYVRRDGFAYIFIGAYPDELRAYLNITPPEHLKLIQVLIWTYRNTLGNNPKDRYKQNYQACLFYRGLDAPNLDCPITNEQWAVQDINAPDGRLGNRYHTWQKPDEIAERFIRHSTKGGDTVFDPFACTGTFLLAAAKLGRKAFGFEISPDNAKIAVDRGCTLA